MAGYLARLALRATRPAVGLTPRVPSLFEAADPAGPEGLVTPPPPTTATARGSVEPGEPGGPRPPDRFPQAPSPPAAAPPASYAVDGPEERARAPVRPAPREPGPRPAARGLDAAVSASGGVRGAAPAAPGPATRATAATATPTGVTHESAREAPASTLAAPDPVATPAGPSRPPVVPTNPLVPLAVETRPAAPGPARADDPMPRLRPGPRPPAGAPRTEVTVSIGRIEVISPPPAEPVATPPARPPRALRSPGAPTLADYLRERSRR